MSARSVRARIGLLAAAAGIMVANLYYAQPLAPMIGRSLNASDRAIGIALTMTQIGYAVGMLLLVPLGDARERRRLLTLVAAAAVPTLILVSAAPNVVVLAVFNFALGVTSSLPQLAVPFAVTLVPLEDRGRAIGPVMGGLLAGILLSRTFSGWLGHLIGWRATFLVAAAIAGCVALTLRLGLPLQRPEQSLSWGQALRSLPRLLREQRLLQRHALVGAAGFGCFSALWATLAFYLASRGHGSQVAGAFGVCGLAGVIAAPVVGRVSHRVAPRVVNTASLALAALSFVGLWIARSSLIGLAIGIALLDAGVQSSHLANQAVIFGLAPEARNRLNAVYMVIFFAGGALGTLLGAWAWAAVQWSGVCATGALLALGGLIALWGVPVTTNESADPALSR